MRIKIVIDNNALKRGIANLRYAQALIIVGLAKEDVIEIQHGWEVITVTYPTSEYYENNTLCLIENKIEKLKRIVEKQFYLNLDIETLISILELSDSERIQALQTLCPEGAVMPKSGHISDIAAWYSLYIL